MKAWDEETERYIAEGRSLDPLAAPRGCLVGMALALAFWTLIVGIILATVWEAGS